MKRIFVFALFLASVTVITKAQQTQPVATNAHPLLTIETLPWRETTWRTVPVRRLEDLPNYDVNKVDHGFGRFGGLLAKKGSATGFFHAQKVDNRWWLVDPDGYLFLNRGVNAVSANPSAGGQSALAQKFGTKAGWAANATQLLRDNGFNAAGNWSDNALLNGAPQQLPYTPRLNFMSSYKGQRKEYKAVAGQPQPSSQVVFVFDADFPDFCDQFARQLADTKNDPYLIGYFSDNELPFFKNSLDNFLTLPPDDPNYKAALAFLQKEHGPNASPKDISDEDRQKFLAVVGEKYFSVVSKAIKKYDPNHLFLGSRFHSNVMDQPLFMQAVGPYLDVVSINYYGQWSPRADRMAQWASNSGKPFLITEFYAKGADTGMANTSGAGWTVKTQQDRGLFYEQFVLGLLECPDCVGWHWFKYMDNDPDAAGDPSNTNSNKGIVDARYEPYSPLLNQMKRVNERAYSLADYFDHHQ